MREKRSEIIRSRITPAMREQLELDLRQRSNVLSMSDYLFELVEDRLAAIRVERQKIGRTVNAIFFVPGWAACGTSGHILFPGA
jgi:hypothetical protein